MASGCALLSLCNPPANTYSYELMQALDAAILRARMDDEVHVIVISGAGDRFFCAGADIAMLDRVAPASNTTSACTPTRRCCASKTRRSW